MACSVWCCLCTASFAGWLDWRSTRGHSHSLAMALAIEYDKTRPRVPALHREVIATPELANGIAEARLPAVHWTALLSICEEQELADVHEGHLTRAELYRASSRSARTGGSISKVRQLNVRDTEGDKMQNRFVWLCSVQRRLSPCLSE